MSEPDASQWMYISSRKVKHFGGFYHTVLDGRSRCGVRPINGEGFPWVPVERDDEGGFFGRAGAGEGDERKRLPLVPCARCFPKPPTEPTRPEVVAAEVERRHRENGGLSPLWRLLDDLNYADPWVLERVLQRAGRRDLIIIVQKARRKEGLWSPNRRYVTDDKIRREQGRY